MTANVLRIVHLSYSKSFLCININNSANKLPKHDKTISNVEPLKYAEVYPIKKYILLKIEKHVKKIETLN
jgi:hypothetical protein